MFCPFKFLADQGSGIGIVSIKVGSGEGCCIGVYVYTPQTSIYTQLSNDP